MNEEILNNIFIIVIPLLLFAMTFYTYKTFDKNKDGRLTLDEYL